MEDIKSRLGGFLHMGKVMECGGLCSLPKSHGAVSTVYASGLFDIRPTAPNSICSPLSVAAHTLYENSRPDVLRGPGGKLHLDNAKYEQLADGRTVRVSGGRFRSSKDEGEPYQWKLESARLVGYRSIFLGSAKDRKAHPNFVVYIAELTNVADVLISKIDKVLPAVKAYVKEHHKDISGDWDLDYHVYGKGSHDGTGPGEIFVVAEAIAPTQKLASSIVSMARVGLIVSRCARYCPKKKLISQSMHHILVKRRRQVTSGLGLEASWKLRWALVLNSHYTISWTWSLVRSIWPWVRIT
jgi:hypothetical protein